MRMPDSSIFSLFPSFHKIKYIRENFLGTICQFGVVHDVPTIGALELVVANIVHLATTLKTFEYSHSINFVVK